MALGPLAPLVDLALLPARIGGRIVAGTLRSLTDRGPTREQEPFATAPPAPAPETAAPSASAPGRRSSRSAPPKPYLDDVALARKVESIIFRDDKVPKSKIDVNAADGVVWLRGEARNPAMIRHLEAQAADVPEVRRVENLLHLPKTPAPSRTDTPASQRKTSRSKADPAKRRVSPGRVTAERPVPGAEPSPRQIAGEGAGRRPSPLGSEEPSGPAGGDSPRPGNGEGPGRNGAE